MRTATHGRDPDGVPTLLDAREVAEILGQRPNTVYANALDAMRMAREKKVRTACSRLSLSGMRFLRRFLITMGHRDYRAAYRSNFIFGYYSATIRL